MSPAYQVTPSMPVYAIIFVLALAMGLYAVGRYLQHDRRPVVVVFAVLMAAISSWELLNFFIDVTTSEQLKLLGKKHRERRRLSGVRIRGSRVCACVHRKLAMD